MPLPILVQKFGGSSVADEEKILKVAQRVVAAKERGFDVVVVVSAMGKTTDNLLAQARRLHPDPPRRELDMLISVGERISMSLLSMAIQHKGYDAISFTGSQSGIITNDRHSDARIIEVRPFRIQDELARGRIVIVAGFQGMSYRREITTLGRGGSDTTAAALAAALGGDCEIYGDVDGVYSVDPRAVDQARHIPELGYQEMQEMAESGAKVLNASCVEFAKEKGIAIFVRQSDGVGSQTLVRKDAPRLPGEVVGVAHEESVFVISMPGAARDQDSGLLDFLDEHQVTGKQLSILHADTGHAFTVAVSKEFMADPAYFRSLLAARFGSSAQIWSELGAVSLIGAAINQNFKNLQRALQILAGEQIHPVWLHTSSFRITFLLPAKDVRAAVGILHRHFIEEAHQQQKTI